MVTCLFKRAHEISGGEEFEKERKNHYEVLQLNSYPPFISKCEEVRILRDYGIRIAFKNYTTLGSILTKVKDKIASERKNGVIYKINFACGDI